MNELNTELAVLWFLTGTGVAIMLLRLALRKYQQQGLVAGDYLTMAAIVTILLRGSVIHVAMVWGTNHISAAARKTMVFTPEVLYRRRIGSELTMINRALYTIYTWLQKSVIMCVLHRLLRGLKSDKLTRIYWAVLAVTFVVAFVMTFVECHPFKVYFQVVPDPGTCPRGVLQLEVFSALNMATDAMLIALPLPALLKIKLPFMERLRLACLFLVGLSIIAVTMTRLLMNRVFLHRSGQSHNVANVEIFFEAFVANAPTIYGLLNVERKIKGMSGARYLTGSYARPRSAGGSKVVKTHGLDSGQFSSGPIQSKTWVGKGRHGNESDEEMMIELESTQNADIHVITTTSVTRS
ncbi:uncharacterized protein BP5553_09825 [Venustampulla echinocandica]|uniref:Rhodopsin domain-containing protein n=1 Tax=Venustampulla echinocandica TaxID=2656787 RepID=A0A370TAS4_9HELO|nr:uncharacterized protein BP5553_09825 [Venustampulla echinocandica]RDL31036.1 hypothetical protein BP5553_09825 [Venustampulla echinocandica]